MTSPIGRLRRVLFVSAFHAPFVQDDLDALTESFHVTRCIGHGVRQILKLMFLVPRTDIVFCWFASVYSFIAVAVGKYFGVKSVIVIGGVDVAKIDDLDYGIWTSPWRARLVRYAIVHASVVLSVDRTLTQEAIERCNYDGKNIRYLPTGYDSSFWKSAGEKEPIVLTVAAVMHANRIRIKGLDLLFETAARLPQYSFIVIGIETGVSTHCTVPSNVTLLPPMKREELLPWYRKAAVYCQPSLREGLSNALCEAMLCECIPVATDVGGTRTAVGDCGILIPTRTIDALADGIQNAMLMKRDVGVKARGRIVSLFPREKRESELTRLITELCR